MPRRVLGLQSETRLHKVRDGFSKLCGVCVSVCCLRDGDIPRVSGLDTYVCASCCWLRGRTVFSGLWGVGHASAVVWYSPRHSHPILPTLSLLRPACERSPACNDSGREVSSLRGRVGQLEASLETAKADAARTLATLQARCVTDVNIDAHTFALTFHAACTCVSWNGTPTFRCA
jgi:hypothetical protein